jgi:hypothetical protein
LIESRAGNFDATEARRAGNLSARRIRRDGVLDDDVNRAG